MSENVVRTTDLKLEELDLQGYTLKERLNGIALMQDPVRADIVRYAAQELERQRAALERIAFAMGVGDTPEDAARDGYDRCISIAREALGSKP